MSIKDMIKIYDKFLRADIQAFIKYESGPQYEQELKRIFKESILEDFESIPGDLDELIKICAELREINNSMSNDIINSEDERYGDCSQYCGMYPDCGGCSNSWD